MKSRINIGKNPVMFGNSNCPACLAQIKILTDHFNGKNANIVYYDLNKYPVPSYIVDRKGNYSMPTWVFPNGKVHKGMIKDKKQFSLLIARNVNFGETCLNTNYSIPDVNPLARCGKNFPNNEGFKIPNSYISTVEKVWGTGDDVLNAGIGGTRSLGPNNIGEMYSNNYYNNIRMAHPSDQLGTAYYLNRSCNIVKNVNKENSTPGMIYDSKNPQIVGFGKKVKKVENKVGNRFGNYLYKNMGTPYLPSYISNQNGGGIQKDKPRPFKINNPDLFIGTAPILSSKFGKKVGEGSVLTLRKNKIKVSNKD
jgi:hypothetical protein